MKDKVLLLGMMGAGKSSVGAALSSRLGWPYLDNDSLLERTAGRTAPEILASDGETALREAEAKVVTLLLAIPGPVIGGVPGGAVVDAAERERMKESGAHLVWLRASVPVLARRVGKGSGRPKLGGDPAAVLRKLAAERNELYEQLADQVVDTDTLMIGAVAKLVVDAIL